MRQLQSTNRVGGGLILSDQICTLSVRESALVSDGGDCNSMDVMKDGVVKPKVYDLPRHTAFLDL